MRTGFFAKLQEAEHISKSSITKIVAIVKRFSIIISGLSSHEHQPAHTQNTKSVWLSIRRNAAVDVLVWRATIPSKISDRTPSSSKTINSVRNTAPLAYVRAIIPGPSMKRKAISKIGIFFMVLVSKVPVNKWQ